MKCAFLFAVLVLFANCGYDPAESLVAGAAGSAQTRCNEDEGVRWVVLLDLSGSVTDEQRRGWAQIVDERVGPRLKPCDSASVFGVHEASTTAAPLFVGSIRGPRDSEYLLIRLEVLAAVKKMRETLIDAVSSASAGQGGAQRTDLLGALDRVSPTDGQPTWVIVFSDGLHVAGDLNMESKPMAGRVDDYVRSVVTRRGWARDQFQNASAVIVLPGHRGALKVRNGPETVREFWAALFAATGGQLVSCETYIPDGVL